MILHEAVRRAGAGRIETVETVSPHRVAIVFGAHMGADGVPSWPLCKRLECALALYEAGKAKKILVSGNDQARHNHESRRMRQWLIDRGVAAADVQADHAGFRTLDTVARAARVWNLGAPDEGAPPPSHTSPQPATNEPVHQPVHQPSRQPALPPTHTPTQAPVAGEGVAFGDGVERAVAMGPGEEVILVSQRYHLPRALYLADAWGLRAVGVSASGRYRGGTRRALAREALARILAWIDVNLHNRQPKHFGPPESI